LEEGTNTLGARNHSRPGTRTVTEKKGGGIELGLLCHGAARRKKKKMKPGKAQSLYTKKKSPGTGVKERKGVKVGNRTSTQGRTLNKQAEGPSYFCKKAAIKEEAASKSKKKKK